MSVLIGMRTESYDPARWYHLRHASAPHQAMMRMPESVLIKHLEKVGHQYAFDIDTMAFLYTHKLHSGKAARWFAQSPTFEALREDPRFARTCAKGEMHESHVVHWNAQCAKDPALLLNACRVDPNEVKNLPQAWHHDQHAVIALAQANGNCLHFLPQHWRQDRAVMFACIVNDQDKRFESNVQMGYLVPELKADRAFMHTLAQGLVDVQRIKELGMFPEHYLNDPQFMLPLVQKSAAAMSVASDALKEDRAFLAQAAKATPGALSWAGPKVRSDIVFMYEHAFERFPDIAGHLIGPAAKRVRAVQGSTGVSESAAFEQVAQQVRSERQKRALQSTVPAHTVRKASQKAGAKARSL